MRPEIFGLVFLCMVRVALGQALSQIGGSVSADHKASLLELAKSKGLTNVSGMGSLHGYDSYYFEIWSDAPPVKDISLRRYIGAVELSQPDKEKSRWVVSEGVRTNLCIVVGGAEKRIELSAEIPVEVARRAVTSFLNGQVSEGLKKERVANLVGCELPPNTNSMVTLVFGGMTLTKYHCKMRGKRLVLQGGQTEGRDWRTGFVSNDESNEREQMRQRNAWLLEFLLPIVGTVTGAVAVYALVRRRTSGRTQRFNKKFRTGLRKTLSNL